MQYSIEDIKIPVTLPVYRTIIPPEDYNLKEIIEDYRKENEEIAYRSNVKAWHSDWNTHKKDSRFQPIIDRAIDVCEYINREYINILLKLECYEFWAAQYQRTEYALPHRHYPVDWACVYYVELEDNSSPIVFLNDPSALEGFPIAVKPGMMLFFPGHMYHGVPPTQGKRTVLAMNLVKNFPDGEGYNIQK
tara:strand:+ start:170 stop:742 length:573 start_codon:yes stop_codon:yes gene_type:complete